MIVGALDTADEARPPVFGRFLVATAPLLVLGSSANAASVWGVRALMGLTLVMAFLTWREERPRSPGAGLCIAGMLAIGALSADPARSSTWIAVAQLMLVLAVAGRQRVIEIDPTMRARVALSFALLLVVSTVVAVVNTSGGEFEELTVGPFGNPNALGMAALATGLLTFRLARAAPAGRFKHAMVIAFGASATAIIASGSRTALGALVLFLGTYWLGRRFGRAKTVFSAMLVAILVAIPVVIAAYTVYLVDPYAEIDFGDVSVGNKRLLSGRNIIWPVMLAAVAERPLTGHGLGRTAVDALPEYYEGLSAHNGYLQVLFQEGVIGLAFYVGLIVVVFRSALRLDDADARAASVAALFAAMVCEVFEVLLTQNHFGIGIVLWIAATSTPRLPATPPATRA